MNKATILIISENKDRNAALVESFGKQFYSLYAQQEETAIDRFLQSPVDAVVFGTDINDAVRSKLKKLFSIQQSAVVFIDDKAASDMREEISSAIATQQKENKASFSFTDDALKNAGLNINIQ